MCLRRVPEGRARLVMSGVVPAAARLLWLFAPELVCLEGEPAECTVNAAAVASLEQLGGASPVPAITVALETASMSVGEPKLIRCL